MNKLFKKIAGVALGLTMAIGVGIAIGESKEVVPASATASPVSYGAVSFNAALPSDGYWTGSGGGSYCGGYGKNKNNAWSVSLDFNSATGIEWNTVDFSKSVSLTTSVKAAGNSASGNVVLSIDNTASQSNTHAITSDFGNGSNAGVAKAVAMNIDSVSSAFSKITINFPAKSFITQFSCSLTFTELVGETYTVSFNSNNGSGTMNPVSDVHGNYILPVNGFAAPSGKAFVGWKANNTGDLIAAGASYNVSADVTFYAQWADQRTLTYNSNGGSGTMTDANSPYGDGATVTVLANTFTAPANMRFSHWNTESDDTGTTYNPNDTFVISKNVILYAIWEEKPSEVVITMDNASGLSGSYSEGTWSSDGISGKVFAIKKTNEFQFSKNTGSSYFYNIDAIPGPITKIALNKSSGTSRSIEMFFGKTEIATKPATGGISNNSDYVWNVDPDNEFTYFYFWNSDSGAAYFDTITITYNKVSLVDPTGITLDNSSDISMDTYGFGNRILNATVEPYNANNKTVTWGSNDTSVVTISDGVLTPVGTGSTSVYAHTSNYDPENPDANLIKTINVTVTQALYKKATFTVNSNKSLTAGDDYLSSGSAELVTGANYNEEHKGIQLTTNYSKATFTISGYKGMKITGVDMVLSSNGAAGTGALTVTAGTTNILEIQTAPFSDPSWNGAYDANPTNVFKATTEYIVGDSEDIVFSFSASVNSIYITSVAIRYLDHSLEQWCQTFLDTITCDGVDSITDDSKWDDLGLEFLDLSEDLRDMAAKAVADKDSDSVIERAMARYDLIIKKYGTTAHDEFIGRFGEGTINGTLSASMSLLGLNGDSTNTTLIIVIISLVSLTAVGGYFLLKKKKEQ